MNESKEDEQKRKYTWRMYEISAYEITKGGMSFNSLNVRNLEKKFKEFIGLIGRGEFKDIDELEVDIIERLQSTPIESFRSQYRDWLYRREKGV